MGQKLILVYDGYEELLNEYLNFDASIYLGPVK